MTARLFPDDDALITIEGVECPDIPLLGLTPWLSSRVRDPSASPR